MVIPGKRIKGVFWLPILISITLLSCGALFAQTDWNSSPYNYKNSPYNDENRYNPGDREGDSGRRIWEKVTLESFRFFHRA